MRFFPPAGGDGELDGRGFWPLPQDVAMAATLLHMSSNRVVVQFSCETNATTMSIRRLL